ncbi:hypothetical protein [Chryseosolibacter indicus]|uniref:hypothetical protein n=1 Tax=Chryseosolibacter indicus TaxID=2782351 RepID=UPI0020B3673A|nr:hypothetical protein [Chryseosolibacter indicus]
MKRYFYVLMLLWFAAFKLQAQQTTYPVQVNVHLLPPYSLYLTDYYSSTREKITVTLINRDQFKPTLNVRLRMTITAAGGVRIQTNDNAYFAPIVVESGAPMRLTQEDLAPYFQHQNLITQGYLSAGKLPEGSVEFCFQVIEAYTGQVLSASTCTRAYVTSQKPPLLSLPQNKESIAFRDPLNVLFQWTPLHQGLAQVEYEFILKELWDNGMTPQAAFPYSPEIYRETTRSTSLIYGAMQPGLLPGKTYAWCVRAKAREGLDEVNLFQNDGYSEIRWFSLQNDCHPPEYVLATAERKRLNLEWNSLPEHIGFTISYRLKSESSFNESQNPWTEQQALETKAMLYGLKNGGTYEYRVGGMCMTGQPVYSPIFTVTLPQSDSARLAQCGFMPDIDLTNQEPIKELRTGDVFMANDYPVTITRISGSNGNFTGEGWTIVPWLADVKLAVQFTDIGVNTDKQMYRGYIDAKYDKTEGQIANVDDVFEGGFDVGNVKTGITKIDVKLDFSIPGVDAFELNDAGELVITDSEGEPHVIVPEDKSGQGNEGNKVVVFPMAVEDKDGNVYQVEEVTEKDATGKVIKRDVVAKHVARKSEPLAQDSFDPTQLDGDKAIVTFEKGDGYYAFDTWLDYYDRVSLIEDKYEKLYTGYYVPWKLLVAGKTDVVRARIEIKDKSIDPSKVIFITPQGTQFKADYNSSDKSWTVNLSAGPAGDAQEIYALHPKADGKYYNLGKLSVATYNAQTHNVTLVSVNGAPPDTKIEQTLADVYGPLGITWQVQRDAFNYNEDAMKLMENSTGINTYNDAMRALNNAYRDARSNFNASANYLFFLKATGANKVNDRNLVGFMPRGAQFGYIFTSEIKDIHEPMTVAHELGHGRFKLYHTFDKHYGAVSGSNETDNFMDYNNGLHVAKWQWDIMNDPAMLVSWFQDDEESALIVSGERTYITPAGTIIKLPAGHEMNSACYDENLYPNGSLLSFTVASKRYSARITAAAPVIFRGYYEITSSGWGQAYQDPNTYATGKLDISFIQKLNSTAGKVYIGEYTITDTRTNQQIAEQGDVLVKTLDLPDQKANTKTIDVAYSGCQEGQSLQAYLKDGKLQKWLQAKGLNADVFISDCITEETTHVTSSASTTTQNATAQQSYNNGTFTSDIALWACWDGNKWNVEHKYKAGAINPTHSKIKAELAQINEEIDRRIDKLIRDASAGNGADPADVTYDYGEDGRVHLEGMSLLEAIIALKDFSKTLINYAKIPEQTWDSKNKADEYSKYPVHVPPMLAGAGDQTLEEMTGALQFVSFGLDLAADPEIAKQTWEQISGLTPGEIKRMIVDAAQSKADKYAEGGVIARHEAGKDVVVVAVTVVAAYKLIMKARDMLTSSGAKLKKIIKEKTAEEIDQFMSSPQYTNMLNAAWNKYKGKLSFDDYKKRYEVLTKNKIKGKVAEEQFKNLMDGEKPSTGIKVGSSIRYFDNVLNGVAREIKSGKVSLSAYKDQILKDLDIIENQLTEMAEKIEWHCFDGIDPDVEVFIKSELVKRNLSDDLFKVLKY